MQRIDHFTMSPGESTTSRSGSISVRLKKLCNTSTNVKHQRKEIHLQNETLTSSDSERNSCIMSLSPMTLTEHTNEDKHRRGKSGRSENLVSDSKLLKDSEIIILIMIVSLRLLLLIIVTLDLYSSFLGTNRTLY